MIKTSIAVLLAIAAGTAVAQQPEFVAGFLSTVPSGYALASLADLQSADFLNQYNSVGINYVQSFGSGFICCVVSVQEGFLSIGPSDSYSNFIEPFFNGTDTCTSNTKPYGTTFGVPKFSPGPYEGMWISTLTTKEQGAFRVTGVTPTISSCAVGTSATAIFKSLPPQYIMQIVGTGAPIPPQYAVASITDLQSVEFQNFYNAAGGLQMSAAVAPEFCCIVQVAEGAVGYNLANGISPVSVYNDNIVECATGMGAAQVFLGTAFGGPNSGTIYPTLNSTVTSLFGTFSLSSSTFCSGYTTSQTLLKLVA